MNSLSVRIFETPDQAPNYNDQKPMPQSATIDHCVVVAKGTEAGKATVDIIFEDHRGTKYVTMTTGALLRTLVAAIDGAEARAGNVEQPRSPQWETPVLPDDWGKECEFADSIQPEDGGWFASTLNKFSMESRHDEHPWGCSQGYYRHCRIDRNRYPLSERIDGGKP